MHVCPWRGNSLGSLTSAFTHHLLDRDLDATYKEAAANAARKKITGRAAQKERVITVREIRGRTTKRAEIAAEKKAKAEINARKRTKKALFKVVKAWPQLAKLLT